MDRDFLLDLFAAFGPVTLRRMFSGYGISVDGVNFALALREGVFFRADSKTIPKFEAEGARPFQYAKRTGMVTIQSYWQLPERLYDDPDELAVWARDALEAARRAAIGKRSGKAPTRKKKTRKKAAVAGKSSRTKRPPAD